MHLISATYTQKWHYLTIHNRILDNNNCSIETTNHSKKVVKRIFYIKISIWYSLSCKIKSKIQSKMNRIILLFIFAINFAFSLQQSPANDFKPPDECSCSIPGMLYLHYLLIFINSLILFLKKFTSQVGYIYFMNINSLK